MSPVKYYPLKQNILELVNDYVTATMGTESLMRVVEIAEHECFKDGPELRLFQGDPSTCDISVSFSEVSARLELDMSYI